MIFKLNLNTRKGLNNLKFDPFIENSYSIFEISDK